MNERHHLCTLLHGHALRIIPPTPPLQYQEKPCQNQCLKSAGTEPTYSDSSQLGAIGRTLGESITKVDLAVQQRKENTEVNVILQAGKLNPPPGIQRAPTAPLGDIAADTTVRKDTGNRPYYRLIEGPYFLSKTTSSQDHRSITNFPSFANTGATFTYWYRHTPCAVSDCGTCE